MPLKKKLAPAIATGCLAVGLLGPAAGSAGAVTVTLETGNNSPQATNVVTLPASSTAGALTAITNVAYKGPGELSNINVIVGP